MTTTHYPPTQYNTPRHCTVQHTTADRTAQQTTTQHTTPLDTLRDHNIVMWSGRVSCGVVWCHVVWSSVVGYRAIGLPVWLVEGCAGCLASGVVWQLGLFVGCLAGWGMLCGVCTLWCLVLYVVVCSVMSCLWVPCNYCHSKGGGGKSNKANHGKSTVWHPHSQRDTLYKTYTRGMQAALDAKDLGRWAELLQARVEYLPYETHPIICMLRATSRTHTSASPYTILIYVAVHTLLMVCYAGKTTLAPTQRLRKHVTTARAGSEDSTFHDMLNQTTELHWTLVTVEIIDPEELGCYRERSWWHTVHKWCLNDTAPALPSTRNTVPGAQHTKQLHTTLRPAHIARVNRHFARAAVLSRDVQRIATHLNNPLCRPVNVTVPYITPTQRSQATQLISTMVRATDLTSWERRAARAHIRVVASAPLNTRRAFERHANKHAKSHTRPTCNCTPIHLHIWQQGGPVSLVQGHYALLPLYSHIR